MSLKDPKSENDVKELAKQWLDRSTAWHYAPVQSGLGVHGIHDRIACLPVTVTQEMVGKRIGLFVSIEAKKPGRRGEPRRGMSTHQQLNLEAIRAAGGLSICCDGVQDLNELSLQIRVLTGAITEEAKACPIPQT